MQIPDFWLSCGHHLVERNEAGWLLVTDDFLKLYLARPELSLPPDACPVERGLHRKVLADPRAELASGEISSIADPDARENWTILQSWLNHLTQHGTLEAAYLSMVRERLVFPTLFVDTIVQVILRNLLHNQADPFLLRAAELFFRTQKLAVVNGSLIAADLETCSDRPQQSPLLALIGHGGGPGVDVLNEDNQAGYWERSDAFDFALDLTAGRPGLDALGKVSSRWIRHFLKVDADVEAATALRDIALNWYVGLNAHGTRIGDRLWEGPSDGDAPEFIVGLYLLRFSDETEVIDSLRGQPTYLIIGGSSDMTLRLKPQNLLAGLPLKRASEALS